MKYASVIIDSREIDFDIISEHLAFLPADWDRFFFISSNQVGKLRIFNGRIHSAHIASIHDYNRLLTSIQFWRIFQEYDKVLIYQQDSLLLRDGIEEFLEWDYVGAPWRPEMDWARADRAGGNGGLSLRCPKKMIALIEQMPYNTSHGNEDVYYSRNLDKIGAKIAPYEVCKTFACESEFVLRTLGFHAIDKHLSPEEVKQIKNQYL